MPIHRPMHPVQLGPGFNPVLAFARNPIFRLVCGLSLAKSVPDRPEDRGVPCHRLKNITRSEISLPIPIHPLSSLSHLFLLEIRQSTI